MTFLGKPYGKWNKVEKPALAPISYERSNDDKVKMVLDNNNNTSKNYNKVSDSESDDKKENLSLQDLKNEVEVTPKTMLNPRVVRMMKKLEIPKMKMNRLNKRKPEEKI